MDAFLDETSYKFDKVSKLFHSIAEISIDIYNHMILIVIQKFTTNTQIQTRNIHQLVVDGGVAQNDFILQSIADLTG